MPETRPNIVIILSDDQGYADVGYHGHCDDVETPHTDELAASGVQLTDGYAGAYVCAPTCAGLMTDAPLAQLWTRSKKRMFGITP